MIFIVLSEICSGSRHIQPGQTALSVLDNLALCWWQRQITFSFSKVSSACNSCKELYGNLTNVMKIAGEKTHNEIKLLGSLIILRTCPSFKHHDNFNTTTNQYNFFS